LSTNLKLRGSITVGNQPFDRDVVVRAELEDFENLGIDLEGCRGLSLVASRTHVLNAFIVTSLFRADKGAAVVCL